MQPGWAKSPCEMAAAGTRTQTWGRGAAALRSMRPACSRRSTSSAGDASQRAYGTWAISAGLVPSRRKRWWRSWLKSRAGMSWRSMAEGPSGRVAVATPSSAPGWPGRAPSAAGACGCRRMRWSSCMAWKMRPSRTFSPPRHGRVDSRLPCCDVDGERSQIRDLFPCLRARPPQKYAEPIPKTHLWEDRCLETSSRSLGRRVLRHERAIVMEQVRLVELH